MFVIISFIFIFNKVLKFSFFRYRTNSYDKDKRRPILRSKSDTAYRYCPARPPLALPSSPLLTTDQLERFFDHLGMDPASYRWVCSVTFGIEINIIKPS